MSDENDTNEGGKGLRAQLEAALEEIKTLKQTAADAKAEARESKVTTVLKDKGVNPKVAKFIGPEVEDIEAWLTENADVFGFTVGGGTSEPNVSADEVTETRRVQNLAQATLPASKAADIQARISQAKDDTELAAIWDEARQFFL